MSHELHRLVKQGNLPRVRELLNASRSAQLDLNVYDSSGHTPLMHAAKSPKADAELVRLLLDHGANIHQGSRTHSSSRYACSLSPSGIRPS